VCVSQLRSAERSGYSFSFNNQLIKETRQRFGEGGIRDGEIGKGRLEGRV
jgi:hypothetical protein